MPVYEYRCNVCGRKSSLFYKSYKDYDAANASHSHTCPHCGSHDLTRLISRVAIQKPGRDYANMSSQEMLSVMEGGDSQELGSMMHQLGQDQAVNDPAFGEVTERLMKGDDPERIERDLGAALDTGGSADA
jgi:putative FmdB family regulatory protein